MSTGINACTCYIPGGIWRGLPGSPHPAPAPAIPFCAARVAAFRVIRVADASVGEGSVYWCVVYILARVYIGIHE